MQDPSVPKGGDVSQPQAKAQAHLLLFKVLLQHQIGQSYLEQDDGLGQ